MQVVGHAEASSSMGMAGKIAVLLSGAASTLVLRPSAREACLCAARQRCSTRWRGRSPSPARAPQSRARPAWPAHPPGCGLRAQLLSSQPGSLGVLRERGAQRLLLLLLQLAAQLPVPMPAHTARRWKRAQHVPASVTVSTVCPVDAEHVLHSSRPLPRAPQRAQRRAGTCDVHAQALLVDLPAGDEVPDARLDLRAALNVKLLAGTALQAPSMPC